MEQTIEL